ncbi:MULTISPECIES: GNAT family N-acetyltransferase [unclassified Streptomyces]|uniref:GNAT family N-acetyltransferase n=1 Tax=unclassified Streptomyces TaxID=2593676 RepID=UPI002E2FA332|nr:MULTISPECIES: GNAT family N-acetyltransferase [unclassified Streptomyces]WUC64199.1 GNAT family N-acetyltransferase [Streptomyces sp. NBC_00539]
MLLADVRSAAPGDATAISRLLGASIRQGYGAALGEIRTARLVSDQCSLPLIRAEIEIPGGAPGRLGWLVAADADGQVVGAVSGGVPVAAEGELYSLCVAAERRRGGIGTALLAAATERMRPYGATSQWIGLPTGLPAGADPALAFLTRHGFTGATPLRLRRTL